MNQNIRRKFSILNNLFLNHFARHFEFQVERDVTLAVRTKPLFSLETPPPSWSRLERAEITWRYLLQYRSSNGPCEKCLNRNGYRRVC